MTQKIINKKKIVQPVFLILCLIAGVFFTTQILQAQGLPEKSSIPDVKTAISGKVDDAKKTTAKKAVEKKKPVLVTKSWAPVADGPSFQEGFADLAEALLPTVVNVSTTQKVNPQKMPEMPNMPEFAPNSPFEDLFRDFFDRYENAPNMQERQTSSLGSGFVINAKKGYIVTNNHVIRDSDEIKVILQDDTSLDATVIGTDEKTDIAVLQVKTDKKLVAARWGDSSKARVGHWILAIGNPFGLGGTVTAGIISANRRDINSGPYDDYIQTDASINRGNSGGPMFNVKGEVIGVNTAIFSPSGGSVGIGFAVPSSLAENVVQQLVKYGQTKRGWLGVRIQEVTDEIAESLGMKEKTGALVSSVTEKGPAAKGGVQPGDVILAFDGKTVTEMRQLPRIVAETEVGKKASLVVWRKGKRKKTLVVLGQLEKAEEKGLIKSDKEPSKTDKPEDVKDTDVKALGLSVVKVSPALRKEYGIEAAVSGLVITKVDPAGVSARKGLDVGDMIVEVDQKLASDVDTFTKAVTAARKSGKKSILLLVSRQGDLRFVAIRMAQE